MILSKMLRLIEKDLMITEVSYETFEEDVDRRCFVSHLLPIPVEIVVLLW